MRGHSIEVREADHHVRVERDGELLAESRRPVLLSETGLPVRYYLPRDDVRAELLTQSTTSTHCPFKGDATYWSVKTGDEVLADLAWSYEEPLPDVEPIAGHLCFFNEKVDLVVDGEVLERPETQWS